MQVIVNALTVGLALNKLIIGQDGKTVDYEIIAVIPPLKTCLD